MKKYNISYEMDGIYHALICEAESSGEAEVFFKMYKPVAKFIGIHEASSDDMKPGKPVISAKNK